MPEMTQHQRMMWYLSAATAHLQAHREAMSGGVAAHLDEAGKIGSEHSEREASSNGDD